MMAVIVSVLIAIGLLWKDSIGGIFDQVISKITSSMESVGIHQASGDGGGGAPSQDSSESPKKKEKSKGTTAWPGDKVASKSKGADSNGGGGGSEGLSNKVLVTDAKGNVWVPTTSQADQMIKSGSYLPVNQLQQGGARMIPKSDWSSVWQKNNNPGGGNKSVNDAAVDWVKSR